MSLKCLSRIPNSSGTREATSMLAVTKDWKADRFIRNSLPDSLHHGHLCKADVWSHSSSSGQLEQLASIALAEGKGNGLDSMACFSPATWPEGRQYTSLCLFFSSSHPSYSDLTSHRQRLFTSDCSVPTEAYVRLECLHTLII